MLAKAARRRKMLLEYMDRLDFTGIDCGKCRGTCCTFEANSMQITAEETEEIYAYLQDNNLLTPELIQHLKDTVRDYRLDQPLPGNGLRTFSRRTYTCPFLGAPPLACKLPREVKPFGCLGFNPQKSGETEGRSCFSDQKLLEKHAAQVHNDTSTEKAPIPVALLQKHYQQNPIVKQDNMN